MARYGNTSGVPLSLAVFLASDYYDHQTEPNTISVTTLIKPLRQIILASRVPETMATVDLPNMMSNRIGAAIHDGIERAWLTNYRQAMASLGYPQRVIDNVLINPSPAQLKDNPDAIPVYLEQRLYKKMGKWTITGKFDFIGDGRVQDFKSASVWSYKKQVNATKQIQQGSLYRWLDPERITKDQMEIHHIFVDWRAAMVKTDPAYPPQRFHTQTFSLMSPAETTVFVQRKLALIDQHWETPEDQLPHCEDEDLWRSDPVFKYYKSGDTTAARSTKNFPTLVDARTYMATDGKGMGAIKEVTGQVKACQYCASFPICSQKDALIASGDLVL